MNEWRECTINDIARINPETLTAGTMLNFINYLDTGNITENKIDTIQYLNNNYPSRAKRIVKQGDVIYSTVRPNQLHYGYIDNPIENLIVSTGFAVLRVKENCNAKFLYYFLTLPENTDYLSNVAEDSTTAYPSITPEILTSLSLSLPPLPTQHAIAEILSSLDDKIDLLTRQNATLEALAQTYFRQWFVECEPTIPLGEIFNFINGHAFKSLTYETEGKYRIITIKNVQDGKIDASGSVFVNDIPNGMNSECKLSIGDVLISLTGNVGRVGIVTDSDLLLNQRVAKFLPNDKILLPFFYFMFRQNEMKLYLENIAKGTAQQNLSPVETLKTLIYYDKKMVSGYVEISSPIFEKITSNKRQIQTLQKLRNTLLPKLISGEVRVAV